jgi:hypothetical protein
MMLAAASGAPAKMTPIVSHSAVAARFRAVRGPSLSGGYQKTAFLEIDTDVDTD